MVTDVNNPNQQLPEQTHETYTDSKKTTGESYDGMRNTAYLYGISVVFMWATVASVFKLTLRHLDILSMVSISSAVSAVILLLGIKLQGKTGMIREYGRNDIIHAAILGFLNPFAYYVILLTAYSLLPAQQAQPLNQTWTIILPILSIYILRQKIGWKNIVALIVSFLGIVIIATKGDIAGFGNTNPLGIALAIGSAGIWAVFWVLNVRDSHDDSVKLFMCFSFGAAFSAAALAIVTFANGFGFSPPKITGIAGAVYIGIFEMGAAFLLWLHALRISKNTAVMSSLVYVVPFISLVFINYFVGEPILVSTVAGLVLIVAGIILQHVVTYRKTGNASYPAD